MRAMSSLACVLDEIEASGLARTEKRRLQARAVCIALAPCVAEGGDPPLAAETGVLAVLEKFVDARKWVAFLAADKTIRSNTSVCLNITAPWFTALPADKQAAAAKKMAELLETEKAGYDIGSYRDAPPGLRIWCGATVEKSDLEALLPWLDWAYAEIEREYGKA